MRRGPVAEERRHEVLAETGDLGRRFRVDRARPVPGVGDLEQHFLLRQPFAAQLVGSAQRLARALERVSVGRELRLAQELDELRQRERALARGMRVDDRRRDVNPLEAEDEVGSGQVLAAEGLRPVSGDVDLQPFGGDERLSQRADGAEVVQPVGVQLEWEPAAERANQALGERASEAVARADQVEAEDGLKSREG
jgi:hypothetical protein